MGFWFGVERYRKDLHKANVAHLTHWQSRGWCRWHGGRLWCTPWENGICVKFLYYLSFSHRHMEATICCIFHSPHQIIPALSLKNKVLTCPVQTLKHYKIRRHQNHNKYLCVTCCPLLTVLLITQSHLSSFSLYWPFHKVSASANMGLSMLSMQCVALSPAYFVNHPNLALKWLICYQFPYGALSSMILKGLLGSNEINFNSFRLFALIYLPDNQKSKGILCLYYIRSSDIQSLKSRLLDSFESLNWDVKN